MKYKIILFVTLLTNCLFSCSEILEPDVSEEKLIILTPRDSLISNTNSQSFFWESQIEKPKCRIQIVKPSFSQIDYFIVDTLVNGTQFDIVLPPSIYSWRIRLENDHSYGVYQYFTLLVDSSTNLTDLKINISSPIQNQFLSVNDSFYLNWNEIQEAQQYEYVITNLSKGLVNQGLTQNTEAGINLGEGFYKANVRAQGVFTNTIYTEINFAIDTSSPAPITNIFPINNHVFTTNQIALSWSPPVDEISPEYDSIYFYRDVNGQNILSQQKLISPNLDTTLSSGVYYWSIRRFDQLGQKNIKENPKRFFIQ